MNWTCTEEEKKTNYRGRRVLIGSSSSFRSPQHQILWFFLPLKVLLKAESKRNVPRLPFRIEWNLSLITHHIYMHWHFFLCVLLVFVCIKMCSGILICFLSRRDLNDLNFSFHIQFNRSVNMAELRKLRRQFISYTKMHPTENTGQISNMFVQYLNKSLHWCFIAFLFFFATNKYVHCGILHNHVSCGLTQRVWKVSHYDWLLTWFICVFSADLPLI